MSFVPFYTPEISLIGKNSPTVTQVVIEGDGLKGNLTKYRVSGKYPESSINKTRHGTITLRALDGLFITKGPILTDELTRDLYLIDVQFFQPVGSNPKGRVGPIMRFEISKAEHFTSEAGTYVTLTLTGGEIRLEQHLDSDAHRFITPKQSFLDRITNYGLRKGSDAPLVIAVTPADIQLPDTPILKQNWIPLQPTPTKKLLNEIIQRISSPEKLGTTNEDYYYYIENSATATKQFSIFAEKFGAQDSLVVLDEIRDVADTKTLQTTQSAAIDNSKLHNTVILRGASGVHHLPMESTRLISDLEHAKLADDWSGSSASYLKDDYVRYNSVRFKSKTNHTSSAGNPPDTTPALWENLETATRGTPWTTSIDIWKPNMAGWQSPPAGYVGFFTDMNIVRPNYDRTDETNEFESVSIKDVEDFINDPSLIPSGEVQHGRRWLVNISPVGAWVGQANKVAQYDESVSPAVWRFSKLPVLGDVVNIIKLAQVLKFNGTNWDTHWILSTDFATSSPFHPVESAGMVADHRGVLFKAVEFRYNWNAAESAVDWANFLFQINNPLLTLFGKAVTGIDSNILSEILTFLGNKTETELETELGLGSNKNLAGRFLGFEFKLPLPRNASGSFAVGDLIKQSHMDFENKTETLKGSMGWNKGLDSEDLSDIRGLQFRTLPKFQDKDNNNINGMANMKFFACWRDLSDRQIWTTATARYNGQWGKITVDAGPNAKGYQLFDSRIDELVNILGFTLPQNFFIKERELTGVEFDWHHVTGFKFYYQGSYDDNGFYTGAQSFILDTLTEHITQALANFAFFTGGLIDITKHIIDHASIAVTDFHFLKDAYVSSEDVENDDSRQILKVLPEQSDYINMKSIAKKVKTRLQHHPQFQTVDAWGDVRARVGRKLKRRGKNIPGGEIELVPSQITHVEDGTGYHMLIECVNKFEVPT